MPYNKKENLMQEEMSSTETLEKVLSNFNGRDPIKELGIRVKAMNKSDLEKLVLIAANTVGTAIKGEDYSNTYDAILHLNMGADMLMNAYDTALMSIDTNSGTA